MTGQSGDLRKASEPEVAVVVLSCDAYSDLWPVFFDTFFRFWPDCPYRVYLASNKKQYPDQRVISVLSGDDTDWSSSVRRSVTQIDEPYLFFLYDDAFFNSQVDNEKVISQFQWVFDNNADYLRLRPYPKPDSGVDVERGILLPNALYRTSCYVSIWKKEVFLQLLVDGESAWAFEMQGTKRSGQYQFYATYREYFRYIHGVERGLWLRKAIRELKCLNLAPDLTVRRAMTRKETLYIKANVFKGLVLRMFPSSMRSFVLNAVATLRSILVR